MGCSSSTHVSCQTTESTSRAAALHEAVASCIQDYQMTGDPTHLQELESFAKKVPKELCKYRIGDLVYCFEPEHVEDQSRGTTIKGRNEPEHHHQREVAGTVRGVSVIDGTVHYYVCCNHCPDESVLVPKESLGASRGELSARAEAEKKMALSLQEQVDLSSVLGSDEDSDGGGVSDVLGQMRRYSFRGDISAVGGTSTGQQTSQLSFRVVQSSESITKTVCVADVGTDFPSELGRMIGDDRRTFCKGTEDSIRRTAPNLVGMDPEVHSMLYDGDTLVGVLSW